MNYFKNLYLNILRPQLVRLYHKSDYFFKFINLTRNILLFLNQNQKTLNEVKSLISIAKQNSIPIFIQFPCILWNNSLFQRPQQIAKAMSEIGYLVIYISPQPVKKLKKISNNLYVTDQHYILKDIQDALVSVYMWYSPNFDKYLTSKFFAENTVFCEYVDHIDEKICGKSLAKISYQRFKNLDSTGYKFLVASAKKLYEELNDNFPNITSLLIENAADLSHYKINKSELKNFILPTKLQQAIKDKKQIIGYFGAIAPWIWKDLIIELAKQKPDYFILMIGPHYGDAPSFPSLSNLFFTGSVKYHDLPLYASYFDVSIMPFIKGDIAKTTSPLKLFEYFAIGKPIIVTSDMLECTKFDGVFSASSISEFIDTIDKALKIKDDPNFKTKYKTYALENSWIARAHYLQQAQGFFNDNTASS